MEATPIYGPAHGIPQCYIHARLVLIHPLVHEISCIQVNVKPAPTPTQMMSGSTPKTIYSSPLRWDDTIMLTCSLTAHHHPYPPCEEIESTYLVVMECWFSAIQQWHSHNAEKCTHIKGRLLYQAMILYNYVPFQNGNFFKRKNLLPEGENSFL